MIIGFDPGSMTGAYGVLDSETIFVECGDLPVTPFGGRGKAQVNGALLANKLVEIMDGRPSASVLAVVEHVSAMPKQGVSSTFRFACSFGIVLGVLGAMGIPYLLVSAGQWKRAMGLSKTKDDSRTVALRKWPAAAPYLALKKHHGRADALLLALYQQERSGHADHATQR